MSRIGKPACPSGEQIINGGFENGVNNWDEAIPDDIPESGITNLMDSVTYPHTGSYSARGDWPGEYLCQHISVPIKCIQSFGMWEWHHGPIIRVWLRLDNGEWLWRNIGWLLPDDQWNSIDLFVETCLWRNSVTGEDHPISYYSDRVLTIIFFYVLWIGIPVVYADDVSLVC